MSPGPESKGEREPPRSFEHQLKEHREGDNPEVPYGVGARDVDVQDIRTRVFEVDPANKLTPLILLHG